ncbi:MAG TPA: hypothetical protein VHI93_03815 [Candidatus Thermoplasmatota archaeon]|nr:hypothetical protein [Candidatus Thermoplasmatota archaeon]
MALPDAAKASTALVAAALTALLLPAVLPSDATSPPPVRFDHKTGNEWWVEVVVAGATVTKVEVMDDGGPWAAMMHKPEWGSWALSYHVEPGHRVTFRATLGTGGVVTSCPFTHPEGVEQCTPPSTFDAAFSGVRGNEWWVQAMVASNGPGIAKVDATLDGGATFKPLAKQSWGGWAASFHIAQGTLVRLRATATDGQVDFSACHQWIPPSGKDAAQVPCPGQPDAFDATFTGVKGNEWWVQVNVGANQPVAGVAVRLECSPEWVPLTKQSWGGWAASFHIPAGSRVDFQARTADWRSDVSGAYTWPQATPTGPCAIGDWPRQGSFATYTLASGVCGGGNCENSNAVFHTVYREGRWMGTCEGTNTFTGVDGTRTEESWASDHTGLGPVYLPPRTQVGAQHRPDMMVTSFSADHCSRGWTSSPVTVQRQEDTSTMMRDAAGQPIVLRAWYAESTNEMDNRYTAHWELKAGLVLDLESFPRRSAQGSSYMYLVDTDAPLR